MILAKLPKVTQIESDRVEVLTKVSLIHNPSSQSLYILPLLQEW